VYSIGKGEFMHLLGFRMVCGVFGLAVSAPAGEPRDDQHDRDLIEVERVPSRAPPPTAAEGQAFRCDPPDERPIAEPLRTADGALTSSLVVADVDGAVGLLLRAHASYGSLIWDWSDTYDAGGSIDLAIPDEVYADGFQRDWLTSVQYRLYAVDSAGRTIAVYRIAPLWLVFPEGSAAHPVWLDEATRRETAPLGAWSPAARASVAALEEAVAGNHLASMDRPTGGAR
jgi:hypothetical protein